VLYLHKKPTIIMMHDPDNPKDSWHLDIEPAFRDKLREVIEANTGDDVHFDYDGDDGSNKEEVLVQVDLPQQQGALKSTPGSLGTDTMSGSE